MKQELLSHPNKLLFEHLTEVSSKSIATVRGKNFDFSLNSANENWRLSSELFNTLTQIASLFHDLGKATPFFQEYIRNTEGVYDEKKNHALISAIFVFFAAENVLKNQKIDNNFKLFLEIFMFISVKRHHGGLENIKNELFIEKHRKNLLIQLNSLDTLKMEKFISELSHDLDISIKWSDFVNYLNQKEYENKFDDFAFDYLDILKKLPLETKISLYFLQQIIYSSILYGDKGDVILGKKNNKIELINILHKIEQYRIKHNFIQPKTKIDELKNEAFENSLKNIEIVFDKARYIYSLTLPTGLGKTITAYAIADKLRKMIGLKESKIIINIPMTSIIDQNFEVYKEILETEDSNILLKHHHLAETDYKFKDEKYSFDESQFLIETWQSDTIVTTFVQLLETFFSCDKKRLLKLPNIANSIVLLDEIQTVPFELWETIRETFKVIGKRFNTYFVLISATQPLIFDLALDIFELVPDYKKYFRFFNRTRLIINKSNISFSKFNEIVSNYAVENLQKDILVILNTKKASRDCFTYLTEIQIDNTDYYYLSTLITPFERKKIISLIKKTKGRRKIIVSTQLVEAGVDISVDTVFRQIAPLDSIIQAAGRGNRYNEKSCISDIYIYSIEDFKKATNLIYGSILITKTEIVLKGYDIVEECDYLQLIENYFKEIRKQSNELKNELLSAITELRFADVNLKLIPEINSDSVFVQLNKDAITVWNKYCEIYVNKDFTEWDRKEKFSKIKSDFYNFVINVPIPYNESTIKFDDKKTLGFYVSHYHRPSCFYKYDEIDSSKNLGYVDVDYSIC